MWSLYLRLLYQCCETQTISSPRPQDHFDACIQSFLLGRDLRSHYGAAVGLDEPNNGTPPRNASLSAPRARSPPERVTINCHPIPSAIDTGLGIALGMFASDTSAAFAAATAAAVATSRGMPDLMLQLECDCRTDGVLIGTTDCASACLQLGQDLPHIPSINVRGDQIHSVSQHKVCSGWRDWLWELYSNDTWHVESELAFKSAKDVMHQLLHGEHVMLRAHPEGECLGCLAGDPKDWNWALLQQHVWESVRAHEADGLRYSERASNAELLAALQPAAEHSWKVRATIAVYLGGSGLERSLCGDSSLSLRHGCLNRRA